jgi:hypothetical protein
MEEAVSGQRSAVSFGLNRLPKELAFVLRQAQHERSPRRVVCLNPFALSLSKGEQTES